MVRWDSPLITIPWDEDPPYEAIWDVVIKGEKKGPTAAVLAVSPPIAHSPPPPPLPIKGSEICYAYHMLISPAT